MKTITLAVLIICACTRTVIVPAPTAPRNVAADNVAHAFPDAKCEPVFQLPQMQSARCVLANGAVEMYCTASDTGYGCTVLREPPKEQAKTPSADAGPGVGSGSSTPPAIASPAKTAPARKP